jgi:uncharacterized protein (DUF362 family)
MQLGVPGIARNAERRRRFTRRGFIRATGGVLAAGIGGKMLWDYAKGPFPSQVFIASLSGYDHAIENAISGGLQELGIGRDWVHGKSVLLKPNLVEPSLLNPHINTHHAVVLAAAEVFRRMDAREVFVAEGPGHCRDTDYVLDESGYGVALEDAHIPFVDLNADDVFAADNRLKKTHWSELWLPQSLRRADLIVSMPKMKTHHWVGATLSMKNLFGIMPGRCYGWPKNVLHQAGISESILDIVAAVKSHLAIVDGIMGMEGDGPIMGSPKKSGVLVLGRNLPAVDATCARLMGIDPQNIAYLSQSSGILGPIQEHFIPQRGEILAPLVQQYQLPPGDALATSLEDVDHNAGIPA